MNKKINCILTVVAFSTLISSCGVKTTVSSNSQTSNSSNASTTTSGSGTTTGTTTGTTSGSTVGCDGVYRNNVTSCYYKNLPEVDISGPGTYGTTLWSSATDIAGTGISPTQFSTDASFSVRMIPNYVTDGRTSKQGRTCAKYGTATNFTKVQLKVMLRKSSATLGEVATLTAINTGGTWAYSNTWRYTVPGGTTDPYILEVVGVQTNDRCTGLYGTAPTGCTYMDIPVVVSPNPTECLGFTLQMATDATYDLPN